MPPSPAGGVCTAQTTGRLWVILNGEREGSGELILGFDSFNFGLTVH